MSEQTTTILVVDDDQFTAELIGMTLEMNGYEAVIADGGIDALDKLSTDQGIGMVISDMNMPVMTGTQLFEELRTNGYTLPFVLLTGDDAEPLRLAYPGLNAVLTKDEQLQETLPALVESLLAVV